MFGGKTCLGCVKLEIFRHSNGRYKVGSWIFEDRDFWIQFIGSI